MPLHFGSKLLNVSIAEGQFPEILKVVPVKLILKAGLREHINNCRPISTLIFLLKIFGKMMCIKFNNYLRSRKI